MIVIFRAKAGWCAFAAGTQHPCGFPADDLRSSDRSTGASSGREGTWQPTRSRPIPCPAFALRFVGQEALPPRLSDFDWSSFRLLSDDVAGIRAQFPQRHRLPAALMLLFHARGRPTAGRFQRTAAWSPAQDGRGLGVSAVHRQSAFDLQAPVNAYRASALAKTLPRPARGGPDDEAALSSYAVSSSGRGRLQSDDPSNRLQWLFTRRIRSPAHATSRTGARRELSQR